MAEKSFMTVEKVAAELRVSKSKAYQIVRELNAKLQKQADKYQKRMNELAPMVKNMEKLAADFGRIKAVVGSGQVNAVINRAKQQEQIEAEQKRAAKKKYNREAR